MSNNIKPVQPQKVFWTMNSHSMKTQPLNLTITISHLQPTFSLLIFLFSIFSAPTIAFLAF